MGRTRTFGVFVVLFILIGLCVVISRFFYDVAMAGSKSAFVRNQSEFKRIVTLSPELTENVCILGCANKIVGVSLYSRKTIEGLEKPKIGTSIRPDIEKIIMLNPDIILAPSFLSFKVRDIFIKLNIEVVLFDHPKTFSQMSYQFLKLARILHQEDRAINIIYRSKNKVDLLRKNSKFLEGKKVFMQIGTKPLYAINNDSVLTQYIEFLGGMNIARDLSTGLCNREDVFLLNPDVIFMIDMGGVFEGEYRKWNSYGGLRAVGSNSIYRLDANRMCNPTIVSFAENLKQIAGLFKDDGGVYGKI